MTVFQGRAIVIGAFAALSNSVPMAAFGTTSCRFSTAGAGHWISKRLLQQEQSATVVGLSRNIRCSMSTSTTLTATESAMARQIQEKVGQLREVLDAAGGKTVVLTGAGVSTDSGIPDYRGPQGSYSRGHKPMTHGEFISSEANRKRYWTRSTFGWSSFSAARPNAAHFALAALEAAGKVNGIITQNVDGLHQKAGSRNVIDLHGRNDKVECLSCGLKANRNAHQGHLARLNADWITQNSPAAGTAAATAATAEEGERRVEKDANILSPIVEGIHSSRVGIRTPAAVAATRGEGFKAGDSRLRADGDAYIDNAADLSGFDVPVCIRCDGVLKPSVVFFGDNIPPPRVQETYRMVDESELVMVAGSSLQVYSAFRLVDRAAKAGKPIAVINQGDTRAETSGIQILKVESGVSTVLPLLL